MQIPVIQDEGKKAIAVHRSTCILLMLSGGLNVLLWVFSLIDPNIEIIQRMGVSIFSLLFGLFLLVSVFFVQKKKSVIALIAAIAVISLDALAGLVLSLINGNIVNALGLIMRGFFIAILFGGIGATKKLRAQMEKSSDSRNAGVPWKE